MGVIELIAQARALLAAVDADLLAAVDAEEVPMGDAEDATKALAKVLLLLAALCDALAAEKQRADDAEASCAATLAEMQSAAHRLWKLPPVDRTLATDDVWRALSHFKPPVAGAALLARLHAAEDERGLAIGQRDAARANLAERDARLDNQNAGLVSMARERDEARREVDTMRNSLALLTAECARLRSDLDIEREQNAAFVKELERLRAVEAGAAAMRLVLNEVGRHAEWANTVRECLRDGHGRAFLMQCLAVDRELSHARQELQLARNDGSQMLNAWVAEVDALRAEVERLKAQEGGAT